MSSKDPRSDDQNPMVTVTEIFIYVRYFSQPRIDVAIQTKPLSFIKNMERLCENKITSNWSNASKIGENAGPSPTRLKIINYIESQ